MAKNSKKSQKSTANKAADYAKAQTKTATKNAYDFAEITKNFANPSQFWNLGSLQNLQPANVQQLVEQMIETSQRNLEAMTACTQLAVERAKELMEEQAQFTSTMMQETAATLQEALTNNSSDPTEKLEGLTEYAKYCMEQTAAHARKATEENIEIAQKIGTALNKRLNDSVEEMRSAA